MAALMWGVSRGEPERSCAPTPGTTFMRSTSASATDARRTRSDILSVQSHELREFQRRWRGFAFEAGNCAGTIFKRPILTQFELGFTPRDRDLESDDGVEQLLVRLFRHGLGRP